MIKSLFTILLVIIISYFVINCGNQMKPEENEAFKELYNNKTTIPDDPLNDRINPLQTFIRDNWTAGNPTNTGGLHYNHIKLSGANWSDIGNFPNGEDQAEFVVDHFDMYFCGGSVIGEHANGKYDNFIWIAWSVGYFLHDPQTPASWLEDSTKNTEGYTGDDLVMHFKYDGSSDFNDYQGWNPADDSTGNGCRDGLEPSDTNRTAECISDAEILYYVPESSDPLWNWGKPMHDGYLQMSADLTLAWSSDAYQMRGVFYDEAAFNEALDFGLQNSFTYESGEILTSNRDYYLDKLLMVPTIAANYIEPVEPLMNIDFVNIVSPYYTCAATSPSKDWIFEYIENLWYECWIMTDCPGFNPITMEDRSDYLSDPFVYWLEEGKGHIFGCFNHGNRSDRGRLFTLATFYMINHQMAFYYYTEIEHTSILANGEHVSEWQWNTYVEYDIGQPVSNSLGLADFQGNSGTNRYFVWEENDEYEVLGREYLKSDGTRVLVLTKLMAEGYIEGGNPTNHVLPNCYQELQPDLTLGSGIREITLTNNDGTILVETAGCQASPDAEFSASITVGFNPSTIDFTDFSTNVPDSWYWNFGDGNTSSEQHPSHVYIEEGIYTVSLTVTNCDGSDTETKTAYITISDGGSGSKKIPNQE